MELLSHYLNFPSAICALQKPNRITIELLPDCNWIPPSHINFKQHRHFTTFRLWSVVNQLPLPVQNIWLRARNSPET